MVNSVCLRLREHLLGDFLKVLGSYATQRALFRRCVTLMDVTTHNTFPFLHCNKSFLWLIINDGYKVKPSRSYSPNILLFFMKKSPQVETAGIFVV
jgi:hypothetical protein